MRRARVTPAVLAAASTLGAILPMHVLFAPTTWARPALVAILVVAATGMLGRWALPGRVLVALTQLVCLLGTLTLTLLRETTWHGIPTASTVRAVGEAITATVTAIQTQAAPVAVTPEVTLVLALAVGVVALVVDVVAVTSAMPAAAGLPLLAAFAASSANTGAGLGVTYFLLPAAAWIALLGHDGVARLQRWGSAVARPRGGAPPDLSRTLLARARGMAVAVLAGAVILPAVIPHFPPTFLAGGLGRADDSRGRGEGGGNRLVDSLAVARSLEDRSTDPVLTYQTDDPVPPPLRVDVLLHYEDGVWRPASASTYDTGGAFPASQADVAVSRRVQTTTIRDNVLRGPQLALPGTPLALDIDPTAWRIDANGTVRILDRREEYTVRYEEVTPTAAQLRASDPYTAGDAQSLEIDQASRAYLRDVLAGIAPEDLGAAETAWRIQAFLRSAQFTYALDLADPVQVDAQGREVPADPLSQFLATRRGYCVQFATAMAMMARHRGIPARVAIGFLQGRRDGETWSVVAADAHAWPELFFPGIGWVRYEPTPGTRSGAAPGWSTEQTTAPAPTGPGSTSSASASAEATPDAATEGSVATGSASDWRSRLQGWLGANVQVLLGLLGAVLALAATPVAGLAHRRLALRRARDDAERVEAAWESMLDGLASIGVRPGAGDTPRQARTTLSSRAHLDREADADLAGVVTTLERARYAPPGSEVDDVTRAARRVVQSAVSKRRLTARVQARLWPVEGRRAWQELGAALSGRLRRRS